MKKSLNFGSSALGEVIVIVVGQEVNEDLPRGSARSRYPTTRVFRYDFEEPNKNVNGLIEYIEKHPSLVDSSQLGAMDEDEE